MPVRNGGGKTRVLIAATSDSRLSELEQMLRGDPSLLVTGAVTSLAILPQRAATFQADVVLLDLVQPDPQFAAATVTLQRTGASVIALVDDPDGNWTRQALRSGILGILPRNSAPADILLAIRSGKRGLIMMEPDLLREVLGPGSVRAAESDFETVEELTDREVEVLRMLAEGLANKEIASRLGISDHTVKFHISSILAKLSVSSRTEAVTVGIRKGLILL